MSVIDFYQEARELEKKPDHSMRKDLLDADSFSAVMYAYGGNADTRLHDCGKDEFFYVIQGNAEMQVENDLIPMKAGEGILIKAGKKHKRRIKDEALIMMITRQPHQHRYYD